MKLACQTIVFGRLMQSPEDLVNALSIVADAGFEGVEISQVLSGNEVGGANVPVGQLLPTLKRLGLSLVSMTEGTLGDRLKYLEGHACAYLYSDRKEWADLKGAMDAGYVVGIHPHIFGEVERTSDWRGIRDRGAKEGRLPTLKFVPDTAHLSIAGDDVSAAIAEEFGHIVAVHLKDWTSEYGSTSHRYARGFCNLGDGQIPVRAVLAQLASRRFDGWVVWELDHSSDPVRSIREASNWLSDNGAPMLRRPSLRISTVVAAPPIATTIPIQTILELSVLDTDRDGLYLRVARTVRNACDAVQVDLWANVPARRRLTLMATTGETSPGTFNIAWEDACFALCARSKRPELGEFQDGRGVDVERLEHQNAAWRATIPIYDPFNPHSVQYILNVFVDRAGGPACLRTAVDLGHAVAFALDRGIDALCMRASLDANLNAKDCSSAEQYMNSIAQVCQSASADLCAVIFQQVVGKFIVVGAPSGLISRKSELGEPRNQMQQQNLAQEILQYRHRQLFRAVDCTAAATWLRSSGYDPSEYEAMTVPMKTPDGKVVGGALCLKAVSENTRRNFTEEDCAVVGTFLDTATENLRNILAKSARNDARVHLRHCLNQPLCQVKQLRLFRDQKLAASMRDHYLGDMIDWMEVLQRLHDDPPIRESPVLSKRETPTFLINGVVAAVVRQADKLLRKRRFSKGKIEYDGLRKIPKLLIDRNRFQQLYLNLLSNAIKYAHNDPGVFAVELDGELEDKGVLLYVRDWGIGIPTGAAGRLFDEGFRANPDYVHGEGLGLAFVKRIVESHGGTIDFTQFLYPTELTIRLPRSIVVTPIQGL